MLSHPASASETAASTQARFSSVVASHFVVDFFSFIVVPLMTVLEARANFSEAEGARLLALGSISSGVIQPIVAVISDRLDTRWMGTFGLALAALAIGCVGFVHSFPQLLVLQALGAAGIGAFHPVATAAAGQLSGARRSRGISVFYAAGMFGSVSAGLTIPFYARHLGIASLAWLMLPGLAMGAGLAWAIHSIPHRHATAHADHAALPAEERHRRWREVLLLFGANAIRFTVNMMLIQLIIRWSEQWTLREHQAGALSLELRARSTELNGPLQAAMSIGMGIAAIAVGWLMRPRLEKPALLVVPALGAIAIALYPHAGSVWLAFILAVLGGIGYAGVMPITITMAQRLLPHRTSLASALMLGGAWTVAASGPPIAQRLYQELGLNQAFMWVAGLLLVSVVLSIPLRPARG